MTTYYIQDDEKEKALLKDLKRLAERSFEGHQFITTTTDDINKQLTELENKNKSTSKKKEKEEIETQIRQLNQTKEKYNHVWVMQVKRRKSKFMNRALTVTYRAGKDGIATVEMGQTKYLANIGKSGAGLGALLFIGGPIGWIIGGSLGLSSIGGFVLQKGMNKEIQSVINNHLELDTVQEY